VNDYIIMQVLSAYMYQVLQGVEKPWVSCNSSHMASTAF